jgi:CheY-like chemotaxis protein
VKGLGGAEVNMTATDARDGRVRILIVDDEPDILIGLKVLLEHQGYYVKTFDNPAQAFVHLASEDVHYDLVITDYRMPGSMSGLYLAKLVKGYTRGTKTKGETEEEGGRAARGERRSRGKKGNTKVFLMSAFDITSLSQLNVLELNEAAISGIVDEIILKPIPNDKLIALIEKNFSSNNND